MDGSATHHGSTRCDGDVRIILLLLPKAADSLHTRSTWLAYPSYHGLGLSDAWFVGAEVVIQGPAATRNPVASKEFDVLLETTSVVNADSIGSLACSIYTYPGMDTPLTRK